MFIIGVKKTKTVTELMGERLQQAGALNRGVTIKHVWHGNRSLLWQ